MNQASLLSSRAWVAPLALALSLAAEVAAQETPTPAKAQPVTEERVQAAFVEAKAAVEAALAFTLDPKVELSLVDPEDLAERVRIENLPLVRLRQPDPVLADLEARQLSAVYAKSAFAKYAWSSRELLVVGETWERQARNLARPELTADVTLRAVLVHELVHAFDDAQHDLTACLAHLATIDAAQGMNSVIEGHAQFEARRVCARAGWSAGFEAYTASIGALPPEIEQGDEATRSIVRVASATLATAYYQGERFMAALDAAGGAELVARAFREPPRDPETVFHPDWYLDPSLRPRVRFDLEPALELFAARYPQDVWREQRISLQPAQVEAALALLPAEQVSRIRDTLRGSRVITLVPRADPNSKMIILAVMEFDGAEAARAYVDAARALNEIKDERMKTGTVRITSSKRSNFERGGSAGFLVRSQMQNGPLSFEALTLDAARGALVVETIFSGEAIEDEAHFALAAELLGAVRALDERPAATEAPH